MAHFLQKPGTAGKWTAATHSLTITLGEVAEIILEGGGPPGKGRLDVGCVDGTTDGRVELPGDGNWRFFRITPKAAGESWYYAKLPGTAEDYAAPLSLITLPRKASSLGKEDIILISEDEGEGDQGAARRRAVNSSPEKEVIVVGSYVEFVEFLRKFRDAGRRIGTLEFFTHGSPGRMKLGKDVLVAANFRYLEGQGFGTIFAPSARVFFAGCNIAKDYKGVAFLMEFGRVFLFNGGSSVAGCATNGWSFGELGNGKIIHPWGGVRRLYFNVTGKVVKWEGMDGIDLSCLDLKR